MRGRPLRRLRAHLHLAAVVCVQRTVAGLVLALHPELQCSRVPCMLKNTRV